MKLVRAFLAVLALGAVAGLAYVAQQAETSGGKMAAAAKNFLAALTEAQAKQASFAFDSPERTNWNFIPLQDNVTRKSTRKGVPLLDMTAAQKKAALELVQAGTSQSGHDAATTIMSLEGILHEQEGGKGNVRDPEWYFFTIFGTPGAGQWGWRVEGHHLSLNFTMDGSKVIASTPAFFGANPAEVKDGKKKGLRILAPAEDLARQLFKALDDDQKKIAGVAKSFPEPGQKTKVPNAGAVVGLAGAKMTAEQKQILEKLLKAYTGRMAADIGDMELKAALDAGLDKVHFAYQGGLELGEKRTYRVHGPTFLIEFLNEQADAGGNQANHIHSAWRRLKGDFGL